jgi:hypothetical protein
MSISRENQLTELQRAQRTLGEVIKGFTNSILKTPASEWTLGSTEVRLEMLEAYWTDFLQNHVGLVQISAESTEENSFSRTYTEIETCYANARSRLYDERRRLTPVIANEGGQSNHSSNQSGAKLPRISIPIFSGKREEWESFRDLFLSLIHNDSHLGDAERLFYLKAHVQGEARMASTT